MGGIEIQMKDGFGDIGNNVYPLRLNKSLRQQIESHSLVRRVVRVYPSPHCAVR